VSAICKARPGANGLRPLHHSVIAMRNKYRPRPRPANMDRMALTDEQRQMVEGVALSIFTDMTNAGCSLQETLSAIYLSGLEHARKILAN